MDLATTVSEIPDSGTESCTDSPIPADDSEHSEDSTVCDSGSSNSVTKYKKRLDILDKAVSVDEETLPAPLKPIPVTYSTQNNTKKESPITEPTSIFDLTSLDEDRKSSNNNNLEENNKLSVPVLPSILRRESYNNGGKPHSFESSSSSPNSRRVSFPIDEKQMVVYRDPPYNYNWMIDDYMPAETILQIYQTSCKQHKTIELDIIKHAIGEIKNNTNHSATLNLSMVNLTNEVIETLEDVLKVANFHTIIFYECKFTLETISEFLNMLEYYESVCEIEVAMNFEDIEAWKCFCNACSNIMALESIAFKGMVVNDVYMRMLLSAIRSNLSITTLKFDSCMLVKCPTFYLVESLMTNTSLCELYLPSTGLYTREADCLGRFLQLNFYLRVLDISNNFIGDRGLEVLARGLTRQNYTLGDGLSVLVIFNNQLTEKSGPIISQIIFECKNLHTLNIGYNNLTDEVISNIQASLMFTNSLEGLGLQCTLLTCKGIDYLADAIGGNHSLEKINLKGNKAIQVGGLERLCQALTNSKITKIEVDETNRSCNDPQAYVQMVKKINAICTVNKSFRDPATNEINNMYQLTSRKVSLSCEPKYLNPENSANNSESDASVLISSRGSSPAISPPGSTSRYASGASTSRSVSGASTSRSASGALMSRSASGASSARGASAATLSAGNSPTVVSRGDSPAPRSRFQIVNVEDPSPMRPSSRFRVTRVTPSPEEEVNSRFAFVRSSVSSNSSSVDSLQLDTDSDN